MEIYFLFSNSSVCRSLSSTSFHRQPPTHSPRHQFILQRRTRHRRRVISLIETSRGWLSSFGYFLVVQKFQLVPLHMHGPFGWDLDRRRRCFGGDGSRYTIHVFNINGSPCAFTLAPSTTSFGNTLKWFQVFYHSVFSLLLSCAKLRNLLLFFLFSGCSSPHSLDWSREANGWWFTVKIEAY